MNGAEVWQKPAPSYQSNHPTARSFLDCSGNLPRHSEAKAGAQRRHRFRMPGDFQFINRPPSNTS